LTLAIIGDSHVPVILKAARKSGLAMVGGGLGGARRFEAPFFEFDGKAIKFIGQVEDTYEVWKSRSGSEIDSFRASVVSTIGMASAILYGDRTWFSWTQRHCSEELLSEVVAVVQKHVLSFYQLAIERGLLLCVVSAPPPQSRHRALSYNNAGTVFRMHRAMQEPVRRLMAEHNIPVIDACPSDQFLAPEFHGNDPSHANEGYGALVVRQIAGLIPAR
jgi:hypothetical protein